MSDDLLAALAGEAADMRTVPTESGTARLREMGTRMVELRREIDELERQTKAKNVELWDLEHTDMPSLMDELQVDVLGLPEAGADLVLRPHYVANIRADWPEEKRAAGFGELDRVGGGDIVKNTITVVFPRGSDSERLEWLERVRGLNFDFDPPEMVEARAVPWNTLTAFVKEQVERGTVLDLEKLGATVGQVVKIRERK